MDFHLLHNKDLLPRLLDSFSSNSPSLPDRGKAATGEVQNGAKGFKQILSKFRPTKHTWKDFQDSNVRLNLDEQKNTLTKEHSHSNGFFSANSSHHESAALESTSSECRGGRELLAFDS